MSINVANYVTKFAIFIQRIKRCRANHGWSHILKTVRHLLQQRFVPVLVIRKRAINALGNGDKDVLKPIVYAMQICTGSIYVQIVRSALCFLTSIA